MVKWQKQDRQDKLDDLLSYLKTNKELRFGDLKQKLGVSDPTLSELTEILEKKGEIERFSKIDDRRETWYRIKPESMETVQAQLLRYDAVRFLDSIEDPLVTQLKGKDGKSSVSIFLSNVGSVEGWDKKTLELAVNTYAKAWLNTLEKTMKVPRNSYRIAVVLTKEK